MPMPKKLIIEGSVHGVGFRVKLIQLALEYGIERFNVFNTFIDGKQAVICLVDAPDEIVELIRKRAEEEKPEKAAIESISVEDYRYEVPPIERCMQVFQMEHWGKAIPILVSMENGIKSMSEKQDEVLRAIREESEKTRKVVKEESEKTRVVFGEKLDLLRMDLREYIEANLKEIHSKISEIEKALKKAGIM
jgi:acylphosphatase